MRSTILRKEMLDRFTKVLNKNSNVSHIKLDYNPSFLFRFLRIISSTTNKLKENEKTNIV